MDFSKMSTLKKMNLGAAVLHFVLAIGFGSYFLILNNKYPNDPVEGVELSMRDHALEFSAEDVEGATVTATWVSKETRVVDIKTLQGMLISFFLITGCFHLFYFLANGEIEKGKETSFNNEYTRVIANGNNFYRWIEYCITSTLMLYIIALSSGVKDTNIYNLIFATNIAMITQGQMVEVAIRDGGDWKTPIITSFLLLFSEFFVIIRDFRNRLNQVDSFLASHPNLANGVRLPKWLAFMIIILFIFFSCFGFISLWGAFNKEKYEQVEYLYILFSFIAKATLGFFLAYGLSQRQSRQNQLVII